MAVNLWMPFFVGDYLRDTIGLSHAEHGAYLLSIFAYWSKGESLTSKELRSICGKEIDRVALFFISEEGRWHHKRIDEELAKSRERSRMAKEKSDKAVAMRRALRQIP